MSYKFESMLLILNKINGSEKVTRDGLAKDLHVDIRTVDRYIKTLRLANFPIIFDEERNTYMFKEGFSLSKAVFSPEEALALGLAKNIAAKFGPRTEKVLESIEHKVSVCSMALPKHIVFSNDSMPPLVEEHFRSLNFAIINFQQVEITYATASRSGEQSKRIIDPHYLLLEGVWYCRAYCRLRKMPLTFALDRIESLTILNKNFLPKPEINPHEFKDAFGVITEGDPVNVSVRFDKCCTPYLKRCHFPAQKEKILPDGRTEFTFRTNGLKGVKLWLYRFIPNVEVLSPKELKREMRDDLSEAVNRI